MQIFRMHIKTDDEIIANINWRGTTPISAKILKLKKLN